MKSFLNLLCHELVRSIYNPSLGRIFSTIWYCYFFTIFSFLLFLLVLDWYICSTYPRLISFCSSSAELYPLSKHRCCINLLLFVPRLDLDVDDLGLLMTVLSTTSVTSFMSWVLAGDISQQIRGYLSYLSKYVFLCLSLLLSVGLFPVLAPLRVTLWI